MLYHPVKCSQPLFVRKDKFGHPDATGLLNKATRKTENRRIQRSFQGPKATFELKNRRFT
jgi:hypothetical protein